MSGGPVVPHVEHVPKVLPRDIKSTPPSPQCLCNSSTLMPFWKIISKNTGPFFLELLSCPEANCPYPLASSFNNHAIVCPKLSMPSCPGAKFSYPLESSINNHALVCPKLSMPSSPLNSHNVTGGQTTPVLTSYYGGQA